MVLVVHDLPTILFSKAANFEGFRGIGLAPTYQGQNFSNFWVFGSTSWDPKLWISGSFQDETVVRYMIVS